MTLKKRKNITSGIGNRTIYFHFEIKVIERIHLTKCDGEKRSDIGQNGIAGLYTDWRLAKIL